MDNFVVVISPRIDSHNIWGNYFFLYYLNVQEKARATLVSFHIRPRYWKSEVTQVRYVFRVHDTPYAVVYTKVPSQILYIRLSSILTSNENSGSFRQGVVVFAWRRMSLRSLCICVVFASNYIYKKIPWNVHIKYMFTLFFCENANLVYS